MEKKKLIDKIDSCYLHLLKLANQISNHGNKKTNKVLIEAYKIIDSSFTNDKNYYLSLMSLFEEVEDLYKIIDENSTSKLIKAYKSSLKNLISFYINHLKGLEQIYQFFEQKFDRQPKENIIVSSLAASLKNEFIKILNVLNKIHIRK